MKTKQPISFRIKSELYSKLKDYCQKYDISQTELIEHFIQSLKFDSEPTGIGEVGIHSINERLKVLERKLKESPGG